MKVCLLGDTHFGANSFSEKTFNNQIQFIQHQLIPYLKENKINVIIQLGDIFDNRRIVDINFLNKIDEHFFKKLKENNIKLISILGNHDIYFKNKRDINLVKFFETLYDNFTLISEPKLLKFDSKQAYFVPWLLPKEELNIPKDSDVVFGHFEIKDFEVIKGYKSKEGLDKNIFKVPVFSGHYHIKSKSGNIFYIGTPYQITWNDYGEKKGFYILDFETLEYQFIENVISKKFIKIYYNDKNEKPLLIKGIDENDYYFNSLNEIPEYILVNTIVKFIVVNAENQLYEENLYYLKQLGVDYNFIDSSTVANIEVNEDISKIDTEDLIIQEIKKQKPELLDKISQLLLEAKSLEI